MKFYEVQKALEDGKKIKSKKHGTFFLKDEYLYYEHDSLIEFIHGFAIYVILAEDWEIVEDQNETQDEYEIYIRDCISKLEKNITDFASTGHFSKAMESSVMKIAYEECLTKYLTFLKFGTVK